MIERVGVFFGGKFILGCSLTEFEYIHDGGGNLLHVIQAELAHVSDAESLILQAAVTVAQLHVALSQSLVELRDGDEFGAALGVSINNGEGLGKILAVRGHAEVFVSPSAGELCALLVAGEASIDAFLVHDVLELLVQSVHEGEAGSGGDENVNPQLVRFNLRAGGGGDGVHEPYHIRVFLHHLGDFLHGVLNAGGSFVMGHCDDVILAGGARKSVLKLKTELKYTRYDDDRKTIRTTAGN